MFSIKKDGIGGVILYKTAFTSEVFGELYCNRPLVSEPCDHDFFFI